MNSVLGEMQLMLPVLSTFGVLFLVIRGKSERATQVLRYLGAAMVSLAILAISLGSSQQEGRISQLEQRIQYLEARSR
jgi:hypothetical protein